jgi:hypothetical protein
MKLLEGGPGLATEDRHLQRALPRGTEHVAQHPQLRLGERPAQFATLKTAERVLAGGLEEIARDNISARLNLGAIEALNRIGLGEHRLDLAEELRHR